MGYAGAMLTGLVLGLLGGGGAMFSIPVLVYLFHIPPSVATGYSLFLVGVTAMSGAIQNTRHNLVDFKAALYYGIPSVITVYVIRRFVIHSLPDILWQTANFTLHKDDAILMLLAVVMMLVGVKMITEKPKVQTGEEPEHKMNFPVLILIAVLIGAFVGVAGAGGGFLMTPALIYFANLHMKKAIGTSLVLVSVNSFLGFAGDLGASPHMDWIFLLKFSGFSIAGVFIGSYFSSRVNGLKLKNAFGWFMVLMGVYIAVREFIK